MAFGMLLLMFAVRLSNSPAGAGHIPLVFGFILFNLLMNAGPNSTTLPLRQTCFWRNYGRQPAVSLLV
jgi:hypothetical protein